MKKGTKGITLIALVITIIVLLILAGITIATLTGENGVLTKANESKEKTTKAGAYEKVEMAVAGSIGEYGELDYDELEKNLNKVEGIDKSTFSNEITKESFPITVTVDGTKITIKENGEVELAFNAEEWDKTAAPEECFVWKSDNKDEEGYNTIIGYAEGVNNYTTLRIPSRCKIIGMTGGNELNKKSRSFVSNIKEVELPDTIITIENQAFLDDSQGGFEVLEKINIPNSVTSIGNSAFKGCRNLTNINIPNSVTSIGNSAFSYCTNLTNITIPNSVTSIEGYVFSGCTNLKNITIPNSVTSIGDCAFGECTSLSSIKISRSVTRMGRLVFNEWTQSQTINIELNENEIPSGWKEDWSESNVGGYLEDNKAHIVYGYTGG